jgi:hypothetical protein
MSALSHERDWNLGISAFGAACPRVQSASFGALGTKRVHLETDPRTHRE